MSHSRKQIRSAIATILRTTPTAWLTSAVWETRIQSSRQTWPYLLVFAESEDSTNSNVNLAGIYDRIVNVSVVALLRLPGSGDTITIEDKMDTVAAEIETKLSKTTLTAALNKVKNLTLLSTAMDVIIEEDGIDHAELNMTWQVRYFTAEGLPEALI